MRQSLALIALVLASLACAADPADPSVPAPTADSIPAAAECSQVDLSEAIAQPYGALSISPAEPRGPFCYGIRAETDITLTFNALPDTYDRMEFVRWDEAAQQTDILGFDEDPSDGFSITVRFPADTLPSSIWAMGTDIEVKDSLLFSDATIIIIEE